MFKKDIMITYDLSDLGLMNYFWGIEYTKWGFSFVKRNMHKLFLRNLIYRGGNLLLVANVKLRKKDGIKKADASRNRSLVCIVLYLTATR